MNRKFEILGGDHTATVAACGVLAATLSAVLHEAIGHGAGCLLDGGTISLLTSIWFRCTGGFTLTDLAGPCASAVGGAIGLLVLRAVHLRTSARLAVLFFAAFCLFWFFGQLIFHAATDTDDWAIVARRHAWPSWWRAVAILTGVLGYWGSVRLLSIAANVAPPLDARAVRVGHVAGAISAGLAGLAWTPLPLRSAAEGLLTLGLAPMGVWHLGSAAPSRPHTIVARSTPALLLSVTIYLIFVVTLGRGIGERAATGLVH